MFSLKEISLFEAKRDILSEIKFEFLKALPPEIRIAVDSFGLYLTLTLGIA